MLQNFRDNLKGAVATFLVVLVSIPFVFFGVDSLFSGGGQSGKAAEVNGDVVSETELRRAVSSRRDQLTQRLGDQIPADFLSDERLRAPVLEGLIQRQLRIQGAQAGRMTISDAELDKIIVSVPAFQTNGQFDPQRFSYLVQSMGFTATGYRQMMRQEIIASQYVSGFNSSGFVTEQQLAQYVSLAEQGRDFYYVTMPLAPELATTEVSDSEIQAHYDANQEQFKIAEKVAAQAIVLKVSDIAAKIDISDDKIAAQYEQNMKSFASEPVRQVAHILVESEDEAAAKAKLQQAKDALAQGKDFAEVAAEFSDDLGTKDTGGDLGFTSGDTFPEPFETALAALEIGQVSEPVQTDAGLHLIKLLAIDQAELPTLAEESTAIRVALQAASAQQKFVEVLERLKEEAYNTDDIATVASKLGLKVQSMPAFARSGGAGLAADPRIVEAAFSQDVMIDGHISPVLELDETSVAVVSVSEHLPAQVMPLADVSDVISSQLKEEKAKAALAAKGESLLAQMTAGEDVEALAVAAAYEWQISNAVKRNDSRYDRNLLAKVFDLALPENGAAYGREYDSKGNLLLVKLVAVNDGQLDDLSAEQRKAISQRLAYEVTNAETSAFEAALKETADIKIY